MGAFFGKLFDTSDYPARWSCGSWSSFEGWLHILSDSAIFAAYTMIPLVIMYYRHRRRDAPFGPLYWMFCLFIFSCGATHLLEAVIFWEPLYRVSGLVKAVTALASLATVVALVQLAPMALSLPGQAALGRRLADEVEVRRQREQELEHRNAELDQFASAASHDLREPLRKIRFFSEQIREDSGSRLSPDSQAALEVIAAAVERSQQLIQGLLDLSRIGQAALPATVLELDALCRRVIADRQRQEPGLQIELVGEAPPVHGDDRLLTQLLENLLGNACKYRCEQRPLQITVQLGRDSHGRAQLSVRDNGIGFDQRQAERIFLPFERLHGRDRYAGVGMGLAICRRIAEAHGGQLSAEGRPDEGAVFRLTLPPAEVALARG